MGSQSQIRLSNFTNVIVLPAGGPGASGLRAGWMEARRWVVDQMPGKDLSIHGFGYPQGILATPEYPGMTGCMDFYS